MIRAQRPELDVLWDELARRMGASDSPVTAVTLRGLGDEARRGLADLLGADRLPGSTCRVRTDAVAAALGVDVAGLRGLVEDLRGPLANRAAVRSAERARREELWAWLFAEASELGLASWAAKIRAAGVPGGDVEAHRQRLADVLGVLDALPSDGISLAALAADVLGDPHALDFGRWSGFLVLEALACLRGVPPPSTAEGARELWAAFGVQKDSLSPSVLVLGLRPSGDDPLACGLRDMAEASEPARITLSQVRRWPFVSGAGSDVFVFENPSILAEAAARGWAGPPLVCTSGWPNVAGLTLLRQLAAAGCRLHLHADWDGPGLAIVQLLVARIGGEPWEMPPLQARPPRVRYEEDMRAELLAKVAEGWAG
ncbi:MAG TPA: TIGR02679 family protein [Actinomycetota bacterium]